MCRRGRRGHRGHITGAGGRGERDRALQAREHDDEGKPAGWMHGADDSNLLPRCSVPPGRLARAGRRAERSYHRRNYVSGHGASWSDALCVQLGWRWKTSEVMPAPSSLPRPPACSSLPSSPRHPYSRCGLEIQMRKAGRQRSISPAPPARALGKNLGVRVPGSGTHRVERQLPSLRAAQADGSRQGSITGAITVSSRGTSSAEPRACLEHSASAGHLLSSFNFVFWQQLCGTPGQSCKQRNPEVVLSPCCVAHAHHRRLAGDMRTRCGAISAAGRRGDGTTGLDRSANTRRPNGVTLCNYI